MKKVFKISVLLMILSMLFAFQVNLDPSSIRTTIKQGNTSRHSLTLSNTGQEEVTVKITFSDWYLKNGKKYFLPFGSTKHTLKGNASVFPAGFILKPGESKSTVLTLVANKKKEGGEYGVVFFEAYPNVNINKSGVVLGGRIGSIIYKEVEGFKYKEISVTDFKAKVLNNKLYVNFFMKNDGNVIADPKVNLVLIDANNEVLAKEVLTEVLALPEDTFEGKYSFNLKNKLSVSNKPLTAIITLETGNDEILTREFKLE